MQKDKGDKVKSHTKFYIN